jgi:hypothetical protein
MLSRTTPYPQLPLVIAISLVAANWLLYTYQLSTAVAQTSLLPHLQRQFLLHICIVRTILSVRGTITVSAAALHTASLPVVHWRGGCVGGGHARHCARFIGVHMDATNWLCVFDTCCSSWWTILAKENSRKLIPGYTTAVSAYGVQRRHWRYVNIVIGGCHCRGELCHGFDGNLP